MLKKGQNGRCITQHPVAHAHFQANPGSQKTYCGPSFIQKRALATLGREIKGVEAQENWGVGGV